MAQDHRLPASAIAMVAESLAQQFSRTQLVNIFSLAGAPGAEPVGNKTDMCRGWLNQANITASCDPYDVLGRVLERYMEEEPHGDDDPRVGGRKKIIEVLARSGLAYHHGGKISRGALVAAPTRSLEQVLRARDLPSVEREFGRALEGVEKDPAAAVTAASAIIESLCRIYIEDSPTLAMPAKQDIANLWGVVKKDLKLDAADVAHDDVKKILGGLASVVDGIGALRTHAGSAHGKGRAPFPLQPRHARLAIHAAHTVVTYLVERMDEVGHWKKSAS